MTITITNLESESTVVVEDITEEQFLKIIEKVKIELTEAKPLYYIIWDKHMLGKIEDLKYEYIKND